MVKYTRDVLLQTHLVGGTYTGSPVHMQIFSSVLRKYFRNTSAEVSLLLARAFYDADQMPQARRALLRAVHLNPTDMQLRFNVALVLQVLVHQHTEGHLGSCMQDGTLFSPHAAVR